MIKRGNFFMLATLLALLVGFAGCSNDDANLTGPQDTKSNRDLAGDAETADGIDIVDTAIAAEVFTTLVAAVQAADLEEALRGDGPFTVFAPNDDAFAKLPAGFVDQLLQPRNFEKLQELLLYHVVSGEIYASDLRRFQFTRTLDGQYLWIRKFWNGTVKVNGTRVIAADVAASNGVIHVIDEVLVPRGFELVPEEVTPTLDIVDTAIAAGSFTTLVAAAGAADLVDALRGGPLTVFAPTDDAFAKLPTDLVNALLLPENQGKLQELLLYHVLSGQVVSGDLNYYQRVATLQGSKVSIVKWFGNVWVNWSRVTTPDVLATNGVIHVINRVLIPQGFSLATANAVYTGNELDELVTRTYQDELPPETFELQYLDAGNN